MKRLIAGIAVAAALSLGMSAARAEAPVKIKTGWITVPTSLAPILFAKPELAKHLGKSYTLEPLHFAGTAPMITALATGGLDIAELAFASFGNALQNGHMTDLRIIADELQDGHPGYLSNGFLVLKDSPIKTIHDLKGKTLATNVIGAGTDIATRAYLRRIGLEATRDYTVIEANFFAMIPMLTSRKADLVTTIPATENDPRALQVGRVLFELKDAMGGPTQILLRVARQGFIAKHRAALVDYFEDEIRELHWYLDPKNHDEAVTIVSKYTKIPKERLDGWLFTHKDTYRDPNDVPDLAALQRNLQVQKEAGFLKIDIDVKKYADLSLVDQAGKRVNNGM
jgi:ABC-type nitrate/sulfonate/bicarbonate transport system substrate-binding protein